MKRIMGVDYGDARTGIAVSDLLCSIVGTTTVIHSRNTEKTIAQICAMVKESDVGQIVVGLPKNMDGTEGARALRHTISCPSITTTAKSGRIPWTL